MDIVADKLNMENSEEIGFRMLEVMTGEHEFEEGFGPAGKKLMEFKVNWGPNCLKDWVNPRSLKFMTNDLEGTVTIEGLCKDVPCKGVLELRYFDEHKIRYIFDFDVDGKRYRYMGEKRNIMPWNLPVSHTTCYGRLVEEQSGKVVSTSITYFRLETMFDFLGSFKLVRSSD